LLFIGRGKKKKSEMQKWFSARNGKEGLKEIKEDRDKSLIRK
jgi:hypothetical protein